MVKIGSYHKYRRQVHYYLYNNDFTFAGKSDAYDFSDADNPYSFCKKSYVAK